MVEHRIGIILLLAGDYQANRPNQCHNFTFLSTLLMVERKRSSKNDRRRMEVPSSNAHFLTFQDYARCLSHLQSVIQVQQSGIWLTHFALRNAFGIGKYERNIFQ